MVLLMAFKVLKVLVLKCSFSPSLYWIFSQICFLGEGLLGKKLLTTRSSLADYTCKLNQRLKKDYKHQNTQLKFYNLIFNIRCGAVYPISIGVWYLQTADRRLQTAVYKSGTGTRGRGHRDACVWDLGLGDAIRETWGHQVWDAGTCGTGKQGRQKQGRRGHGMWTIIAKVGGKCNISFFVKMCCLCVTVKFRK